MAPAGEPSPLETANGVVPVPERGAAESTAMDGTFLEGRLNFPPGPYNSTDEQENGDGGLEAAMERVKRLADGHKKMLDDMNRSASNLPSINVCIMVVGTHGDVSPFCALGKRLKANGHRVRIATHANYRKLVVQDSGLEFYPLAGDPGELSEFMVKTGGKLIPDSWEAIENLPAKLEMMRDIIFSSYPAATAPDPDGKGEGVPGDTYVADAIISNPPVYGHHHVAEALRIPLHLMFPQPWVPTCAFPHPLACVDTKRRRFSYKREWSKKNKHSYYLVQRLEWAGMGGILNAFRSSIGLEAVDALQMDTLYASTFSRVPFVHMWSPSFVPKPPDWGPLVDVVGNFFSTRLEDATWDPPEDLKAWLAKGDEKPILVTFGSMKFDNAETLTRKFFKAASKTGARVLLQSGWSELGIKGVDPTAQGCFIMGRAPHDWLMQQCSAVIHHGGAGTTAAGLRCGLPTLICPFFGDQHFWGEMVRRANLGPAPRPIWELTTSGATQILVDAFQTLRHPEVIANAQAVAAAFAKEDGAKAGMEAFKRHLPVENMSCPMCLRLCSMGICAKSRKAEIDLDLAGDKGDFVLCRTCYSVIKRESGILTDEDEVKPAMYQKWGEHGPVAPDFKRTLFGDVFNREAAIARRAEARRLSGSAPEGDESSEMSWWDRKYEELSGKILEEADKIISKNVLLPGDEEDLEKQGYETVLGQIREARLAYNKEREELENWIREPGEVDMRGEEREAITVIAREFYEYGSILASDPNAKEVGMRLASESLELRPPRAPRIRGRFRCVEKCFNWECKGELTVFDDHLEFKGDDGQKTMTSNGSLFISIPFKKIREAFVNSQNKNTWDGTGVQIRLRYHRFGSWGFPLLSYNFTRLDSLAAAKQMHKVIEGALAAFDTQDLARLQSMDVSEGTSTAAAAAANGEKPKA